MAGGAYAGTVSPNRRTKANLDHARERAVIEYFEAQAHDAARNADKVKDYTVRGQKHEVWDVLAASGRWWVVTNPMSFYSQEKFPILDEVFTASHSLYGRSVPSKR